VLIGTARLRGVANGSPQLGVRRIVRAGLVAACVGSILLGLLKIPGAATDSSFRAGLLDAVALLSLAGLAVSLRFSAGVKRGIRILGPVVYSVLALSAAALLRAPELRSVLGEHAPVPLGPWAWFFAA
jgi:hypothetical protein